MVGVLVGGALSSRLFRLYETILPPIVEALTVYGPAVPFAFTFWLTTPELIAASMSVVLKLAPVDGAEKMTLPPLTGSIELFAVTPTCNG